MTTLVYRQDGGCPPSAHRRDELCARTALKKLQTDEPVTVGEDEREGGAT